MSAIEASTIASATPTSTTTITTIDRCVYIYRERGYKNFFCYTGTRQSSGVEESIERGRLLDHRDILSLRGKREYTLLPKVRAGLKACLIGEVVGGLIGRLPDCLHD